MYFNFFFVLYGLPFHHFIRTLHSSPVLSVLLMGVFVIFSFLLLMYYELILFFFSYLLPSSSSHFNPSHFYLGFTSPYSPFFFFFSTFSSLSLQLICVYACVIHSSANFINHFSFFSFFNRGYFFPSHLFFPLHMYYLSCFVLFPPFRQFVSFPLLPFISPQNFLHSLVFSTFPKFLLPFIYILPQILLLSFFLSFFLFSLPSLTFILPHFLLPLLFLSPVPHFHFLLSPSLFLIFFFFTLFLSSSSLSLPPLIFFFLKFSFTRSCPLLYLIFISLTCFLSSFPSLSLPPLTSMLPHILLPSAVSLIFLPFSHSH